VVAPGGDPNGNDPDKLHWITNLYSTGDNSTNDGSSAQPCMPSGQPDGICAALFAGTSQATPHVTGAAALLLANSSSLTPSQVAQYLESTADDICSAATFACPAGTSMEGHGRVNIYKALSALQGLPYPAYTPAVNQFIAFAYQSTLTTGTANGSGGSIIVANGASSVILDTTYPLGVPITSTGTFRIGDLPMTVSGTWKIGVWYNAAGNGVLSSGDLFGKVNCSGQTTCSASGITLSTVSTGNLF
jgi:subtilisin family serine protease